MTDQTPVTFPWRTDFENAPSPCIGWCTPPAGDDVRQIWRHSHLKGQWTAHSITQTVKAWQPLPSIGIDGGVAQQPPSDAVRRALELARKRIEYFGGITDQRHREANEQYFFPPIDGALADLPPVSSTPSPAVAQTPPSGWKLVPVEPTDAMVEVGCDNNPTQWNEGTDNSFAADVANDVYVSMVRSAPAAPQQSPRLDREVVARIIDPDGFSGLETERAWAAQWKKSDDFWLPWQKRCDKALEKSDAILALLSPDTTVVSSTTHSAPVPEPTRWPTKGDTMTFLGKNGYPFELEAALKVFSVGQRLLVEDCHVDSWSHSIKFVALPGRYNGVMFELCTVSSSTDHSAVDAIAERSPGVSKGTIRNLLDAELCDDCPPRGYPTDKTRCRVCPRVSSKDRGAI